MSFITGKPFVDKILSGLESSELARLQALINNPTPVLAGTYRTYKLGSLPEDTLSSIVEDNGYFKYVNFSYDPVSMSYLKGILCKTSDGYAFFSWEPLSKVMTGGVVEQNHYSPRLEQLTTEEFRRVLADLLIEAGGVEGYVTEEELKEKAAIVIETNNITSLTKEQLDSLKVGDVVQKKTGNEKHCYVVTYKGTGAGTGICLSYVDAGYMETVSYDRSGSNWVYNSTDKVEVPSSQDIQNMLVGKYVRIMDAPESTTLTDEQIAQFRGGVFINGPFLGIENPLFFPSKDNLIGIVIGATPANNLFEFYGYTINATTKIISLLFNGNHLIQFNLTGQGGINLGASITNIPGLYSVKGKVVPSYPANTGTFTLKMVDGVLTWVADA